MPPGAGSMHPGASGLPMHPGASGFPMHPVSGAMHPVSGAKHPTSGGLAMHPGVGGQPGQQAGGPARLPDPSRVRQLNTAPLNPVQFQGSRLPVQPPPASQVVILTGLHRMAVHNLPPLIPRIHPSFRYPFLLPIEYDEITFK